MIALYKAPHKGPEIVNIDNTLPALQEAVGGHIETVTLCTDLVILCNEEALFQDVPFNCNICGVQLFGPILVVSANGEDFCDLKKPEVVARMLFGKEG